jgi:Gram-negative bacterial TonB protein C-terminal
MRNNRWWLIPAACVAISLTWYYGIATPPRGFATSVPAKPDDVEVAGGTFQSRYFGLTFPLPRGWSVGPAGPSPSGLGDYVLATLVPEEKNSGAVVITAHDMFFADPPVEDAVAMIAHFRTAAAEIPGMKIDREPSEVQLRGKVMQRIDFSGVGLRRVMLATEIRCHLVRFNLTAAQPLVLAAVARSLDDLSFDANSEAAASSPVCMKSYATDETVLKKVEPLSIGPTFTPIPVRIIIGTDGAVKAVHVIRATAEQREGIENAMRQWRFKPFELNGRAVEVETGLSFRFIPRPS